MTIRLLTLLLIVMPLVSVSAKEHELINDISPAVLFHWQTAYVSEDDESFEDTEMRRERIGFSMDLLNHINVSAMVNSDIAESELYKRINSAHIAWSPNGNDSQSLKTDSLYVGKLKPRFTKEYGISSKHLQTFERSLLITQLAPAKTSGIMGRKNLMGTQLELGLYAGELDKEFSRLDPEGAFAISRMSRAVGQASLGLDVLVGSGDVQMLPDLDYSVSMHVESSAPWDGASRVWAEAIYAAGREDGDRYGLTAYLSTPILSKGLIIARIHAATADEDTLRPHKRYERLAVAAEDPQAGDGYHSCYLGFNWQVLNKKANLKLMSGLEYAILNKDVYDGWTALCGVRLAY